MNIRFGKSSGFCKGVQSAVQKLEQVLLNTDSQIYTLGDIIHNRLVIEDFEARGVKKIENIALAEDGSTVIIRAHGCGRDVYKEAKRKNINLIDATCADVKKVHEIALKKSQEGYEVIIFGNEKHAEVIGTLGWCDCEARVLSSIEQINQKNEDDFKYDKAILISQTTANLEEFEEVAEKLTEMCGELIVLNTICPTTKMRQDEARELAETSDVVIVVGSTLSANTSELVEIARQKCDNVMLIEKVEDISLENLQSNGIISIIAGASTPRHMMMEVFTRMNELDKNKTIGRILETHGTVDVENTEMTPEQLDFLEAFEKTLVPIRSGQVITGTVVQVNDNEISVNIGYKSDGFIPRSEFTAEIGTEDNDIKVGDEIEVEVIKVNDSEGNVLLSHKSVEARKAWDAFVDRAEVEGALFAGIGREVVKGGLIAYIDGVRTFVPASHVSNRYVENLHDYVGQPLRLQILEVDRHKRRVVASQKLILQEEAAIARKEVWKTLEVGQKRKGIVRRLTDFGAFVDIGGIDGLIHVTEMAWGRVKHPKDIFSEGDEIEVVIKTLDSEKERISLGYKELQPDPWDDVAEQFPVGSVVEGKVVRIKPFGAFISLLPRIDGLIHISQVSTKRIDKVEDELKIGQVIDVKVLNVDPEAKRISLSIKELLLDAERANEANVIETDDAAVPTAVPAAETVENSSDIGAVPDEVAEVIADEVVADEVVVDEVVVDEVVADAVVDEIADEKIHEDAKAISDDGEIVEETEASAEVISD